MNKRIFISIEIPKNIKEKLIDYQEEINKSFINFNDSCPIKWARKDDMHITLLFLGYVELNELQPIFKIIEEITEKHESFNVELKNLSYGPSNVSPKMIWANGEKSDKLDKLQNELSAKLLDTCNPNEFTPHITLGKIIRWEFNRIELEERPDVYKEISLSIPVRSIEVMESDLKKKSGRYAVLRSFPLK